ncbi:Gluconolactonase [Ensifer adhaerens]|uniref:SMP-30/gluconolactonase/LRE family protein n=1 Tax=Ensifer adhaerens TaxID=106592 RepID=UPI00156A4C89|nr:SMP-30/gluconolactonase/LRE family protein [Ensifer adhaerens]NRP21780.1 Gluconolactonase [Ensifer adhaerens]
MLTDWFEVKDPRFTALVFENVHVEKLWSGARWTEGPAYVAAGKYLLFSDIPNDRIMRFDETNGAVSVFETPCGFQNGRTVDPEGRVVACEHGGRRVSRREHDGSITELASSYKGKRLNSPNDVVVRSDGSIWFTDPTYGIDSDYEGHKADSEIGASYVYRIDADGGDLTAVATDFAKPNGLAFSLDEKQLYISDTGLSHDPAGPHHIRVFDIAENGRELTNGRVFATCDAGVFDGFRLDCLGNVWASAGDGVHCFAPDGTLLGKIRIPEAVANVEFGGLNRNRLFITATQSLYSVYVRVNGARNLARHVG